MSSTRFAAFAAALAQEPHTQRELADLAPSWRSAIEPLLADLRKLDPHASAIAVEPIAALESLCDGPDVDDWIEGLPEPRWRSALTEELLRRTCTVRFAGGTSDPLTQVETGMAAATMLATAADTVQDAVCEALWRAWPPCELHQHPLAVRLVPEGVFWVCPTVAEHRYPIGSLPASDRL